MSNKIFYYENSQVTIDNVIFQDIKPFSIKRSLRDSIFDTVGGLAIEAVNTDLSLYKC